MAIELTARIPADDAWLQHFHEGRRATMADLYHDHFATVDDRTVPSAQERLASALGLAPRRRARLPGGAIALLVAACAAVLAVSLRPAPATEAGRFADPAPRGGAMLDGNSALYVYRITAGAPPRPVIDGVIGDRDELAFAYRNLAGWSRLLVFAVDAAGRVYWYHPGWTDAMTAPVAVPIDAGPEHHELSEAIAQPLPPGRIEIHAIFTDDAIDVLAIERGRRPAQCEELVVPLEVVEGKVLDRDPGGLDAADQERP